MAGGGLGMHMVKVSSGGGGLSKGGPAAQVREL